MALLRIDAGRPRPANVMLDRSIYRRGVALAVFGDIGGNPGPYSVVLAPLVGTILFVVGAFLWQGVAAAIAALGLAMLIVAILKAIPLTAGSG
jgi:hypothetical protein